MVAAIIVAAGKGIRMRGPLRKQYMSLAGLPILVRTLTVFDACDLIDHIFVVIPAEDFDFCRKNILTPANFTKKIDLVAGGVRRQDSVYNGLQQVDQRYRIIAIHDGVRPFILREQLVACVNEAKECGACILGVPAFDTLKRVDDAGRIIETFHRDTIWLAQTPQVFRHELIKKAHDSARADGYAGTDDASLVERLGVTVRIISGSRRNMKITSKEDFQIAHGLLRSDRQ